jgi:hypothetical protein
MKKLMIAFFTIVVVAGGFESIASAQELPQRTQWAGVNPFGLLFDIYSGHYGRYLRNGEADITISFLYWQPTYNLSLLGGGANYHIYKDGDGTGLFYGGGATCLYASWDSWWDENVTAIILNPKVEAGYRWLFGKKNEWTIAPSMSLGMYIGKIEGATGEIAAFKRSRPMWGLGLGLAYVF